MRDPFGYQAQRSPNAVELRGPMFYLGIGRGNLLPRPTPILSLRVSRQIR